MKINTWAKLPSDKTRKSDPIKHFILHQCSIVFIIQNFGIFSTFLLTSLLLSVHSKSGPLKLQWLNKHAVSYLGIFSVWAESFGLAKIWTKSQSNFFFQISEFLNFQVSELSPETFVTSWSFSWISRGWGWILMLGFHFVRKGIQN